MVVYQLISNSSNQLLGSCQQSSGTGYNQNPSSQNYLSLLVIPKDAASSKQETNQKPLIHNILPATSTKDELLAAILSFELEEITSVPLFSGTALDTKPITVIYTDAKVDINRAASARIITADGATKTSIGEINNFSFEVNSIIVPIKVLVIETTQYQALVGNNWLTKTNTILDWTMQKLQLSQNSQHTHVPATCSHFKTINTPAPLIKFEEEEKKPTWKAYQVLWIHNDHNELPPILSWDDNTKEKQREELTWETDDLNWIDNNKSKSTPSWEWEENSKRKEKVKEKELLPTNNYTPHKYTPPQPTNYC
ncbi:hypothetical protein G9A89_015571 [Geosiphon pyriformis]|nr:hypothetical protein G9A89_015571 [Geosiphon pyriformis]